MPDAADPLATTYSTRCVLMSGLAMFGFRFPSMMQFDAHSRRGDRVECSLKTLYGVDQAPCDTTRRAACFRLRTMACSTMRPALVRRHWSELEDDMREFLFLSRQSASIPLLSQQTLCVVS